MDDLVHDAIGDRCSQEFTVYRSLIAVGAGSDRRRDLRHDESCCLIHRLRNSALEDVAVSDRFGDRAAVKLSRTPSLPTTL